MREMPRYKCHKEVWALKIAQIYDHAEAGAEITPAEDGYSGFVVSAEYMQKHKPQIGGYYVVYADDYTSYSPAKAFEEGYTLVA